MSITVEFMVLGDERIHCSGCESRIVYALRRLPGVQDVRANFRTQHVMISIDAAITDGVEQARARLEALGYGVTLVVSCAGET